MTKREQDDQVEVEAAAIAFFNEMQKQMPESAKIKSWDDDAGDPDAEWARNAIRAGAKAVLEALSLPKEPVTGERPTRDEWRFGEPSEVTVCRDRDEDWSRTATPPSTVRNAALEEAAKLDAFSVLHGAMLCIASWPGDLAEAKSYAAKVAEDMTQQVTEAWQKDSALKSLPATDELEKAEAYEALTRSKGE